jgi:integrase
MGRLSNSAYRSREYLTTSELARLMDAASLRGRHGLRDKAIILIMFRHGLRVGEAVGLNWDQIMLDDGLIDIHRLKGSVGGQHPLQLDEVEILTALKARYGGSGKVFRGERGDLSVGAIQKMVGRAGEYADLPFQVHPHMLRHSCGYHLANQGAATEAIQSYMGHKEIENTLRYIAKSTARYQQFSW